MRMSLAEYNALMAKRQPEPKKPKYRNEKKEYAGLMFDSTKEANRYADLLNWQTSGQITELTRQTPFAIEINGEHICDYVSDFTYKKDGQLVVEDVKSKATRKLPLYGLKKKLVKAVLGIEIQEV